MSKRDFHTELAQADSLDWCKSGICRNLGVLYAIVIMGKECLTLSDIGTTFEDIDAFEEI